MIHALLLFLLLVLQATPAAADEFKPAYLQLTQRDATAYDVLWKVPALDEETTLALRPVFPPAAKALSPQRASYSRGASVIRWRINVPGGLDAKPISFAGNSAGRTDVLVRLARLDGTEQLERISSASATFTAVPSPGPLEVITSYTWLGIEHILLGIDHLLFVAALVMLVRGRRQLFLTITAFTIAHSITLALATIGVLKVAGPPVEAVIALSIAFVCVEIVQRHRGHPSLASKKPWLVAFSFGLLHGLGFAGALAEVGLPEKNIPLALLFFNVGVEIGQLVFVGALLAVAATFTRLRARYVTHPIDPRRTVVFPAYAVGGLASFWLFERIAAFAGG
jgi:hydrogenase/urease accessory protein HupE